MCLCRMGSMGIGEAKKSRFKKRLFYDTQLRAKPQSSNNDKSRTAPLSADITSFA